MGHDAMVPFTDEWRKWEEDIAIRCNAPFPPNEIEWVVSYANDDRTSGCVEAYADARAIQRRLDSVFGWTGWKPRYETVLEGNVYAKHCVLWTRLPNGEWRDAEDGADASNIHPTKGGISNALKRAASATLGIGRYLHRLPEQWVRLRPKGAKGYVIIEQPVLPAWAVPEGTTDPAPRTAVPPDQDEAPDETPRPLLDGKGIPLCPKCGGGMSDDRTERRADMDASANKHGRPAFSCLSADCGGMIESVGRWVNANGLEVDPNTGEIVPPATAV